MRATLCRCGRHKDRCRCAAIRREALEEAALFCEKIARDTEEINDEYSRKRLPAVAVEPDCEDLAYLLRALANGAP